MLKKIIFTVAVLGVIGVSGMSIYHASTPTVAPESQPGGMIIQNDL